MGLAPGEDDGDSGADGAGADFERAVAGDEGGVADFEAADVGDGVERAGGSVKGDAEVAGALLGMHVRVESAGESEGMGEEEQGSGGRHTGKLHHARVQSTTVMCRLRRREVREDSRLANLCNESRAALTISARTIPGRYGTEGSCGESIEDLR
jgi:hypothetical protein